MTIDNWFTFVGITCMVICIAMIWVYSRAKTQTENVYVDCTDPVVQTILRNQIRSMMSYRWLFFFLFLLSLLLVLDFNS